MKYDNDPRFGGYYFEDSYVLSVDESEPSRLAFSLLLVLTPQSPFYTAPEPNERYCYRNGTLAFEGVSAAHWVARSFMPVRDRDGAIDYGNIDVFEIEPEGRYYLEGEWGRLIVAAQSANVTML